MLSQGQQPVTLEHGTTTPLHTCKESHQVAKITLCDYLGANWTYDGVMDDPTKVFSAWVFNRDDKSSKSVVSTTVLYRVNLCSLFYIWYWYQGMKMNNLNT